MHDYAGGIDDFTHALELERGEGKPADSATLAYRGWAYLAEDAPKLALRDFDEALRQKGSHRADCYGGRGYARVLLGLWRPAVADGEAALKEEPPKARTLYNAARIYAQAAARVATDLELPTGQGAQLRREQEYRALSLLRAACLKAPLAERTDFWTDPALRPISGRTDFAQLRSEFSRPVR